VSRININLKMIQVLTLFKKPFNIIQLFLEKKKKLLEDFVKKLRNDQENFLVRLF